MHITEQNLQLAHEAVLNAAKEMVIGKIDQLVEGFPEIQIKLSGTRWHDGTFEYVVQIFPHNSFDHNQTLEEATLNIETAFQGEFPSLEICIIDDETEGEESLNYVKTGKLFKV